MSAAMSLIEEINAAAAADEAQAAEEAPTTDLEKVPVPDDVPAQVSAAAAQYRPGDRIKVLATVVTLTGDTLLIKVDGATRQVSIPASTVSELLAPIFAAGDVVVSDDHEGPLTVLAAAEGPFGQALWVKAEEGYLATIRASDARRV